MKGLNVEAGNLGALPETSGASAAGTIPASTPTRRRRTRDLSRAVTLRPDDIFQLYGIPPSTLHDYCNDPDPARRLTSVKIPSRGGTKGVRLVKHTDLRAWLERWSTAAA